MQTMFTGFYENGEILNDSQKIRLPFQKVQNPILTQIKASLQVSYDMDQSKKATYDFIAKSLEAYAVSIGDPPPRGVADINTRGKKTLESGIKGEGGAILTGFYPNRSKTLDGEIQCIFDEKERLNSKGRGELNSLDKKNRASLHPSSLKIKRLRISKAISHI